MEGSLVGIAGAIILLQLGIIGYYISKDNRKQEVINEKFSTFFENQHRSNEDLATAIKDVQSFLAVLKEQFIGLEKRYEEHKEVCKYTFGVKPDRLKQGLTDI